MCSMPSGGTMYIRCLVVTAKLCGAAKLSNVEQPVRAAKFYDSS